MHDNLGGQTGVEEALPDTIHLTIMERLRVGGVFAREEQKVWADLFRTLRQEVDRTMDGIEEVIAMECADARVGDRGIGCHQARQAETQ